MRKLSIINLGLCLFLSLTIWINNTEAAEEYPAKPIIAIFPGEAGSDMDLTMRPLVERVSAILGKPIVIVNKPGAGQTIGYRETYQSKPDGYTIGLGMISLVTNKMQGKFQYDHRDFTLIGHSYSGPTVVVASTKTQNRFNTIQEVISYGKSHPGKILFACSAVGGAFWTSTMLVQEALGINFNVVPQEGSGGMVIAQVAGGHFDLGMTGPPTAKTQVDAGNVRALATTGTQRVPGDLNYCPTLKELGYDVDFRSFTAIIGPPKMPKNITDKIVKAFETAINDPEYKKFIISRNENHEYLAPEQLLNFCEKQRKVLGPIFEKAGLLKEK